MSVFANSFEVDVPTLSAEVYGIDPQPPNDNPWRALDSYETAVERNCRGSAHRIPTERGWSILSIEAMDSQNEIRASDGTKLVKVDTTTVGGDSGRYQSAVKQALRDSLEWFVTTHLDFWERGNSQAFYEWSPSGTVGMYDTYHGYKATVEYKDGYYLTVDSTVKFISSMSVAEYLSRSGRAEVEERFFNRYCTLMSDSRPSVELVSLANDLTVSDKSMMIDGEEKSVLGYIKEDNKYSQEVVDSIRPDEPIARVLFPWSDSPVDTAPSLLHPLPDGLEPRMTGYAARSAGERWSDTKRFVEKIDYIQVFGADCGVSHNPRRGGNVRKYPSVMFGEKEILEIGQQNPLDLNQTINERNWRFLVRDFLKEFGPAVKQRGAAQIDVLHPEGRNGMAEELFSNLGKYLENFVRISVRNRPGIVSYSDYQQLREWRQRHADDSDGALVLLEDESDRYHDIAAEIEGIPTQGVRVGTYQDSLRSSGIDDAMYNVACGLATKMGVRPFLLSQALDSDLFLGMSVTGDEVNNAAAVLVSGSDGNLIGQTQSNLATGPSTVTGTDIASRIVRQQISAAVDKGSIDDIESLTIHRNGQFGDGELEGIRNGIAELQSSGDLTRDFTWQAVGVSDSSNHRLYSDGSDLTAQTGSIMPLDEESVIVVTFGEPHVHQATPNPLYCTVVDGEGKADLRAIGNDILDLSFLNWGSPMMKMKHPLTTHLPAEMHDILSKGTQLSHPPF